MNQTKKALYLSPEVMVFDAKTEGVICNIGGNSGGVAGPYTYQP